jgi:hypothetical protein
MPNLFAIRPLAGKFNLARKNLRREFSDQDMKYILESEAMGSFRHLA